MRISITMIVDIAETQVSNIYFIMNSIKKFFTLTIVPSFYRSEVTDHP